MTRGEKLMGKKSCFIILWWLVILVGSVEQVGPEAFGFWNQLRWERFVQEIAFLGETRESSTLFKHFYYNFYKYSSYFFKYTICSCFHIFISKTILTHFSSVLLYVYKSIYIDAQWCMQDFV